MPNAHADIASPHGELESSIAQHLEVVKDAQSRLAAVLDSKRQAIVDGDDVAMLRCASVEETLTAEFVELESQRSAILVSGRQSGADAKSLTDLSNHLGLSTDIRTLIADVQSAAEKLQREAWTQMIVAARAKTHYEDLIEMIAAGGQKSESYDDSHTLYESGGGNLLDAAA